MVPVVFFRWRRRSSDRPTSFIFVLVYECVIEIYILCHTQVWWWYVDGCMTWWGAWRKKLAKGGPKPKTKTVCISIFIRRRSAVCHTPQYGRHDAVTTNQPGQAIHALVLTNKHKHSANSPTGVRVCVLWCLLLLPFAPHVWLTTLSQTTTWMDTTSCAVICLWSWVLPADRTNKYRRPAPRVSVSEKKSRVQSTPPSFCRFVILSI